MLLFRWAQCRGAQPLLWDYASERLSEEAMERVEKHLRHCAGCHKELDSLKRAQNLLAACRAQDEPAPRSDWNDLQQRLVADGLAQIAPSSAGRRAANPARRERGTDRFGMAGRAPWAMQLATSAAGGFAAVLVLALGYQVLHLHNAPGSAVVAAATYTPGNNVALFAPSAQPVQTPVAEPQNAQAVASIIKAFNSLPTSGASVVREAASTEGRKTNGGASEVKTGAFVKVNLPQRDSKMSSRFARAVHVPVNPASSASRRLSGNKMLVAINKPLKLRSYNTQTTKRKPDAPMIQVADRYALEHVQPIGNDGDDSNSYVVGSVRPIARDDEGVY